MTALTVTTGQATIIVAIVSAVSVSLSAAVTSWLGRRREQADIDSVAVETAERAVVLVRGEMDRMAATIAEQTHQIEGLRRQVLALQEMVRNLGGDPRLIEGPWPL